MKQNSEYRKYIENCRGYYSDAMTAISLIDEFVENNDLQELYQYEEGCYEINDEEYDLQMNTNFRSSIKLLQLFVPPMQQRKWGRVITVGSVQQRKPHEAMLVYSASKMALYNAAVSLAPQLAPDGVTINNLAPGAIRTDRNAEALSDPAYDEKVRNLIPMKYIGVPDDIAGIAVFMASEESKYMTAQDIYVDGGKCL
jgi:NAD(P)-dependent dehydrogenase (short-subunit alcohol dehydrogenase family)